MGNPFVAVRKFFTRRPYASLEEDNGFLQASLFALRDDHVALVNQLAYLEDQVERLSAPPQPILGAPKRSDGQNPVPAGAPQPVAMPMDPEEIQAFHAAQAAEHLSGRAAILSSLLATPRGPGRHINPPQLNDTDVLLTAALLHAQLPDASPAPVKAKKRAMVKKVKKVARKRS